MRDPLLDKDFLKALDLYNLREVSIKIISLTQGEEPVAEITGSVLSGNVKVDGKSSVRRTCSLQLTTNKSYSISDVDWALRTKFSLYIGLKNFINQEYDDIIYFPMGIFVLTAYSFTFNDKGFSITLSGKDKMCLLNGDIGGAIFADTTFNNYWEKIKGTNRYTKKNIVIKTIIREMIHEYAVEPYSNIVINDLDTCGVELLNYRAKNNPIYVYTITYQDQVYTQMCFEDSPIGQMFQNAEDENHVSVFFDNVTLDVDGQEVHTRTYRGDGMRIPYNNCIYTILKRADYEETIGFRATDLVYPSDLVGKVGDSITSILDKIVKMLGEFEYYYDLDGRFIFQRKRIYYNTSWSNAVVSTEASPYTSTEYYYDSTAYTSADTYILEGSQLVSSYQNKPSVTAVKNDYSIWGTMKGVSKDLPIHIRCAIDIKPTAYFSKYNKWKKDHETWYNNMCAENNHDPDTIEANSKYIAKFYNEITQKYEGQYDWRELIYRMAKDAYSLRGLIVDINTQLNRPDKIWSAADKDTTTTYLMELQKIYDDLLQTGYASYYTDILGFWTELYRTAREPYIVYKYDASNNLVVDSNGLPVVDNVNSFSPQEWEIWRNNGYWNPDHFRYDPVHDEVNIYNPNGLYFWFDFLNAESVDLYDYSVEKVGRRLKTVNDTNIKSIFVRDVPNVLFVDPNAEQVQWQNDLHYVRLNLPTAYTNYLVRSTQGKSAKEELDTQVYQGTYYNETISISAIPVYYLQPNTRIKVYDEMTGIDGDYLINSISYQFTHDGFMTVDATRAEKRIL